MRFYVTGDTHGQMSQRIEPFKKIANCPRGDALIILGDAGFNYYGDRRDKYIKESVGDIRIYCVHGNHEERAWNVYGYEEIYDEAVQGWVWVDPDFSNIRFFNDFQTYIINGYKCLVLGGAYSVDKHYRLARGWKWFPEEQLSKDEMMSFSETCKVNSTMQVDFILSHTCPLSFQPTHLFIPMIDQSTVDNTMEVWMEELKDIIKWKKWYFGHYHDNWSYDENVKMFFEDIKELKI